MYGEGSDDMKRFLWILVVLIFFTGCQFQSNSTNKVKDLEFTIVEEGKLPEKLSQAIQEKKKDVFKLTFQDQGQLFICVGYGEQPTGGYSISVEELYLTENAVCFDTTLKGPGPEEQLTNTPSYPYIVVLTEDLQLPVVFQ